MTEVRLQNYLVIAEPIGFPFSGSNMEFAHTISLSAQGASKAKR